jgi:mono/diheme cytochrome c family protein
MRTNQASLALSIGMGLIVLLIGFLALSAAGLVGLPGGETLAVQEEKEGTVTDSTAMNTAYVPASPAEAASIAAGDALFKNNCAQCHAVNEKVVGPALAGISKRRSIAWLIPWVKNSSKVIATGDEYAVKLFNDNGKQQMPSFQQLSDTEIKGIVAWVTSQEGGAGTGGVTDGAVAAN